MQQPIKLTKKQSKLYKLLDNPDNKRILIDGAARSSKTTAIMCYLFSMMREYPGIKILCLRSYRVHIKTSLWDGTAKELLKDNNNFTFEEGTLEIKHTNSSVLRMDGLDTDIRSQKILGTEYGIIFVNECVSTDYKSVKLAISRLSQQLPNLKSRKLIMDCNPSGQLNWVYQLCIKGIDPETNTPTKEKWQRMSFLPSDNPYLPEDSIESLSNLNGVMRRRLFLGEWCQSEGLIYPEFDPSLHLKDVNTTNAEQWICGCDAGYDPDPMVILTAAIIDVNGIKHIHINDMYYEKGKDMSQSIGDIMEKYKILNPFVVCDPSASPMIVELKSRGFNCEPANNKIIDGITIVRDLIKTNRITINPKFTEKVVEEFSSYEYDERTDKPKDGTNRHILDSLRYLCFAFQDLTQNNISQICVF